MKTFIVKSTNQHGDNHFFYPKAKDWNDAIKKGEIDALRKSSPWNTWVVTSAELFDIKIHARD